MSEKSKFNDQQPMQYDLAKSFSFSEATFDALALLKSELKYAAHGDSRLSKTDSMGAIAQIDLPAGVKSVPSPTDGGGLPADKAPHIYSMAGDARSHLGLAHSAIGQRVDFQKVAEVFNKPPHSLNDDEYFKVSDMMTPGPWSGSGHGHELGTHTQEINGKKVLVYDYWRPQDLSKDSPFVKMGQDDVKVRIIFAPNEKNHTVDVMWLEAPVKDFDKRNADFQKSLDSIKWKH